MQTIDIILLVLYSTAIACSCYIIHRHKSYFHERFQKGVVSVFMLAMLFFLIAYTFKMLIVWLIRLADLLGWSSPELLTCLKYAWTFAQLGTTGALMALTLLTASGRYDQFVHLKVIDRKGEKHAESDANHK